MEMVPHGRRRQGLLLGLGLGPLLICHCGQQQQQ
jgi:hypothetical protein